MINFRTIKAKDCCCGCTLKTGTLILLWMNLILNTITTLYYFREVVYGIGIIIPGSVNNPYVMKIRPWYFFIGSVIGMVTSLLGIYGVQKDDSKHLTFFMYYLGYYVIHFSLSILIAIFFPTLTLFTFIFAKTNIGRPISGTEEFAFVMIVMNLFFIAMTLYFMIIVRSFRDSIMKNMPGNKADEIPDSVVFDNNIL